MATKTIQFLGQGYGNTPVTATATVNGTTVFTGTIPTLSAPANLAAGVRNAIFTCDIDESVTGNVPLTIQASGGLILLGAIHESTGDQYADCRSNVEVNGVAQVKNTDDYPEIKQGIWTYHIPDGKTLTATITL